MDNFFYPAPSLMKYNCTLLIHCHKQGSTIETFLQELEEVLAPIQQTFLVVLIDNASKDNTRTIIENYSFQSSRIDLQLVPLPSYHGLQAAIQLGLSSVKDIRCDHFIVMDTGSHDDPKAIPALLEVDDKDIVFVDKGPKSGHFLFWLIYRFHQFFFWLLTYREIRFDHYTLINRKTLNLLLQKRFLHYATALHIMGPLKKEQVRFEHRMEGFKGEYQKLFRNSIESLLEFGEDLLNFFLRFSLALGFLFFAGLIYSGITVIFKGQELANWIPFALIGIFNGLFLGIGFLALGIILLKRHQQVFPQAGQYVPRVGSTPWLNRVPAIKNDPVQLN